MQSWPHSEAQLVAAKNLQAEVAADRVFGKPLMALREPAYEFTNGDYTFPFFQENIGKTTAKGVFNSGAFVIGDNTPKSENEAFAKVYAF